MIENCTGLLANTLKPIRAKMLSDCDKRVESVDKCKSPARSQRTSILPHQYPEVKVNFK